MTNKTKPENRILEAVHETARDFHRAGFIDVHKMRQYDALCQGSVPAYDSAKIRALRNHFKLSQSVLASALKFDVVLHQKAVQAVPARGNPFHLRRLPPVPLGGEIDHPARTIDLIGLGDKHAANMHLAGGFSPASASTLSQVSTCSSKAELVSPRV